MINTICPSGKLLQMYNKTLNRYCSYLHRSRWGNPELRHRPTASARTSLPRHRKRIRGKVDGECLPPGNLLRRCRRDSLGDRRNARCEEYISLENFVQLYIKLAKP